MMEGSRNYDRRSFVAMPAPQDDSIVGEGSNARPYSGEENHRGIVRWFT